MQSSWLPTATAATIWHVVLWANAQVTAFNRQGEPVIRGLLEDVRPLILAGTDEFTNFWQSRYSEKETACFPMTREQFAHARPVRRLPRPS